MRTAFAVSPHLDDAAFSAGAALARLSERGWRVVIATVCTRTVSDPQGFALACQLDKGLPADADYMALRRAEDERACAALGAEPVHLGLPEAPHRGYEDARALFGPVRVGDPLQTEAAQALIALAGRLAPDLVLLPRALGAHVDHVTVRRAAEAALPGPRAYWTDWPYASRKDVADPFAGEDRTRRRLRVPTQGRQSAKLTACAAYATQIGFQFGGHDGLRASLAATQAERFLL